MKIKAFDTVLTLMVLFPMTLFLSLSFMGIGVLLADFSLRDVPLLLALTLGVFGYAGLVMNLLPGSRKLEGLGLLFLVLGFLGFVLFCSVEGGNRAWQWILFMEEPGEWLVFVGPLVLTLVLIWRKAMRLARYRSE